MHFIEINFRAIGQRSDSDRDAIGQRSGSGRAAAYIIPVRLPGAAAAGT